MLVYDLDTRLMIAREHAELLRAQAATNRSGNQRARRWLSARLIAAGRKLEPECPPQPAARGATV
jgi:hypothetical protein